MSIEYWTGTKASYLYRKAIDRIILKLLKSDDDSEPILCARLKHIDILDKALEDFLLSYRLEHNSNKNIRVRQIKKHEKRTV